MTPPRVTVIVPFLNGDRFIREALESVLSQTYTRWELLLVDDGSQESATTIARQYAEQYPDKVRYLEHPGHDNRGVCASRNLGIRHARGEFIALLDADDLWLPRKLEEQVRILDSHPSAAMVYGSPLRWHHWPGHDPDVPADFTHELGVPDNTLVSPPLLLVNLLSRAITPLPSDVLIRKDVAVTVGGFDDTTFTGNFQFYEDQAFFAKVFVRHQVFAAAECWTWYRQHADSCVAVVHRSGWFEEKRSLFLRWVQQYLRDQQVHDAAVYRALEACLPPPPPTLRARLLAHARKSFGALSRALKRSAPD